MYSVRSFRLPRDRRRTSARLIAMLLAILVMAIAVVAAAAPGAGLAQLTLSTSEGPAGGAVTATYRLSAAHCLEFVQFFWDGQLVSTARLDAASCAASATLFAPAGASTGPHAISAEACHGKAFEADCVPATTTNASEPYVIEPAAFRSLTPTATAPSALPTTGRTVPPTASPTTAATAAPTTAPTVAATDSSAASPTAPPTAPSAAPTTIATAGSSAAASTSASGSPTTPGQPPAGSPGAATASSTPSAGSIPTSLVLGVTSAPGASGAGSPGPAGSETAGPSAAVSPAGSAPSARAPGPTAAATNTAQGAGTTRRSGPPGGPITPPADQVAAFVANVPDTVDLDRNVIATNLGLTLLLVILFGLTSEVFNSTIDENRDEIEGWADRIVAGPGRFLAPLARLDGRLDRLTERGRNGLLLHAGVVLVLTGFVYGFLSPDFGWNPRSLTLFLALAAGLGLLTYIDEGTTALLAARNHKVPSTVRMYGTAVAVAVVSVLVSRLVDFHPGFMYGFIASAVILAPVALAPRQQAQLVIVPSLVVLGASLGAWLLLDPVRSLMANGDSWPLTLLDSVLATVFVAGLEGLFFGLVPIRFLDGAQIMRWSRVAWAVMFGTVTFLWWQLLINRDGEYADAFKQTDVQIVLTALVIFMVTTGGVWLFFWLRERSKESAEEPAAKGGA